MSPLLNPERPATERLRVLVVHNRYRFLGGEDKIYEAEAELLQRHGHRVERYELHNDDVRGMAPMALAARTLWSRKAYHDVRARAVSLAADVVHLHNWLPLVSPSVVWAGRHAGAAVVHSLHNFRLVCPVATLYRADALCERCVGLPVALPAVRLRCYRGSAAATAATATTVAAHRAFGTWSRGVDRFFAVGPSIRDKVVEGGIVPASRVEVKPNLLPEDPPVGIGPREGVLFVGRLVVEKGVESLISAWQGDPGLPPLTVVGEGPLEPLVRSAAELEHVTYAGPLPRADVLDLMRRSALLAVPSEWYEGWPITILEAYASGTPVVGSSLGAVGKMVRDGTTGVHVAAGDPPALARTVREAFASGTLAQMGVGARAEYDRRYSSAQAYRRLVEGYRRAIRTRHPEVAGNFPSGARSKNT